MKYNTLITDTGLSFSGGQKQRILLARVPYLDDGRLNRSAGQSSRTAGSAL